MITIDELKAKLGGMKTAVDDLRDALSIEASEKRLAELEHQMTMPGFYDDQARSQKVISEMGEVKNKLERFGKLSTQYEEAETLLLMIEEENDPSLAAEGGEAVNGVEKSIDELQLMTMLNGEYDHNNAILTFHAGTGGTEAQDWAEMLLRMYTRWAARHSFSVEEMDYLAGEEAGVKRVTLRIIGSYAFGLLRSERGIHRLIRISPFDSSGRRHTSFASVDVIPDVGSEIKLDIKESDLRIDTFHASGPGGQGVNTTTSAVRITHLPTGITAQCQNERSQHHNKDMAMRILKARLYNLEIEKRDAERQAAYDSKNAIAFGSQIRTYTLQPFQLIKDHRTGCESTDCAGVLDGDIDKFAHAYLLYRFEKLHRNGEK